MPGTGPTKQPPRISTVTLEPLARKLCELDGYDPDVTGTFGVKIIREGRLTDTGHDTRKGTVEDVEAPPMWTMYVHKARKLQDFLGNAQAAPVPTDEDWNIRKYIDFLRADEGDSVTLLCDNPDFNGQPNCAIECNGYWTNWEDRRFAADTLQGALELAYFECQQWRANPPPEVSPDPRSPSVSSTNHSSPAATTGDTPSGSRPPASAAMGQSAGDEARAADGNSYRYHATGSPAGGDAVSSTKPGDAT